MRKITTVLSFDEKITEDSSKLDFIKNDTNTKIEFSNQFQNSCLNTLKLLGDTLIQIEKILSKSNESSTNFHLLLYRQQLNESKITLLLLKESISNLVDWFKGIYLFGKDQAKFANVIKKFRKETSTDFFESIENLVKNSLFLSETYFNFFIESKVSDKELEINIFDLDILLDAPNFLKNIIIEKYNSAFKELNKKSLYPLDDQLRMTMNENYRKMFFLEVAFII